MYTFYISFPTLNLNHFSYDPRLTLTGWSFSAALHIQAAI